MSFNIKYRLFVAALLVLLFQNLSIKAQPNNTITVSVKNVNYEDAGLSILKANLKHNPKINNLQSTYTAGAASIKLIYSGDAEQLWNEIPKSVKQKFKVEEIVPAAITIVSIAGSNIQDNNSIAPAQNKPLSQKKDGCFDCQYFPLCEYDESLSYSGKIFRGIRNDDNTINYYYCENGTVTKKWQSTETVVKGDAFNGYYDDEVKKNHTLVILKSNAPVGTTWTQKDDGFDFTFKIIDKNISLDFEGTTYKDVLKLQVTKLLSPELKQKMSLLQQFGTVKEEAHFQYYAKNKGFLTSDDIFSQLVSSGEIQPFNGTGSQNILDIFTKGEKGIRDEQVKKDQENSQKTAEEKRQSESKKALAGLKGSIDLSLSGLWKKEGKNYRGDKTTQYIRFNNDGTADFYESVLGDKFTGYLQYKYDYRINNTEFYRTSNYQWTINKYPGCLPSLFELKKDSIIKLNETFNNKPVLLINDEKCYFIEPNK